MSIFVYGIIMLLFLTFAIVLSQGKGAFLIAGFNTMPEEEKSSMMSKHWRNLWGK